MFSFTGGIEVTMICWVSCAVAIGQYPLVFSLNCDMVDRHYSHCRTSSCHFDISSVLLSITVVKNIDQVRIVLVVLSKITHRKSVNSWRYPVLRQSNHQVEIDISSDLWPIRWRWTLYQVRRLTFSIESRWSDVELVLVQALSMVLNLSTPCLPQG